MSCEPIFFCNYSYVVHTEYIYIYIYMFINWTLRMSDNLPERVQILCHVHIICITVLEHRIICCQIFGDLLLKSAFERIFNVVQLILVKIKWHIKWKYLIQKFHDICLSYYFKIEKIDHFTNKVNATISQLISWKYHRKLFLIICHYIYHPYSCWTFVQLLLIIFFCKWW